MSDPISLVRERLEQLDCGPRGTDQVTARCPAHDDRAPSLSVGVGDDGRVLLTCHAGCPAERIIAALGMTFTDLHPDDAPARTREIIATYGYTNESGDLLYEVVRLTPKSFRQRRPDGQGGYLWSLNGARRVLYRLPAVLAAVRDGRTIYIVEGERDVHAVEKAGAVATCNSGGAGKWRPEYAEALRNANVVVIADQDDPGRKHARTVAQSLQAVGATVRLTQPAAGKDAADHLAAGHTLEQLQPLAENDTAEAPGDAIRFVSAAELKAATPAEPPWILDGYLAPGNVTLFSGKPKAGKSRFSLDLTTAAATGAGSFIGRAITHTPIVYVSEEGASTLAHKLPDCDGIRILTRENAWPKPDWPTLIEAAVTEAKRVGAALLVVDTLAYWSGLPPEREKDAGAALQVMEACLYAASVGLAVLVPTHTRKGGGEDGEGLRGSSAFAGAADIIIELERIPDAPRQRALLTLSRYPQTPGTLVVELDHDGTWHAISEDADRGDARAIAAHQRSQADRQAILDALEHGDLTRAELENATDAPSRQWHPTLDALIKDGAVTKTGGGVKGNPYRYKKVRTESCAQPSAELRTNGGAGILLSAHPRRGAETESTAAAFADAAPCAQSTDWTDHELQALVDNEDWSR